MNVQEYAQYLLENFPHDAEIVRPDTGCSCCEEYNLYHAIGKYGKPRLIAPVIYYGEDPDECDSETNTVDGIPFDAPKVAI